MPKRKRAQYDNKSMCGLLMALNNDPVPLSPLAPVTGKVLDHAINKAAGVDVPLEKEKK